MVWRPSQFYNMNPYTNKMGVFLVNRGPGIRIFITQKKRYHIYIETFLGRFFLKFHIHIFLLSMAMGPRKWLGHDYTVNMIAVDVLVMQGGQGIRSSDQNIMPS